MVVRDSGTRFKSYRDVQPVLSIENCVGFRVFDSLRACPVNSTQIVSKREPSPEIDKGGNVGHCGGGDCTIDFTNSGDLLMDDVVVVLHSINSGDERDG